MCQQIRDFGKNAQKVSVQELKLSKPEELKRFTIIDLWETRVDRSLTSGENTPGGSECSGVETPEARIAEVNRSR
jgi:hypothetical protein